MSLDPVIHFDISPFASFGNNPILMIDPNGDDLVGTSDVSASRALDIIQSHFKGEQCSKLRDLFRLNSDGVTFSHIDEEIFTEAIKELPESLQQDATLYKNVINNTDFTQYVCVPTYGAKLSKVTTDFLSQISSGIYENGGSEIFNLSWGTSKEIMNSSNVILKTVAKSGGGMTFNLKEGNSKFRKSDNLIILLYNCPAIASVCYTITEFPEFYTQRTSSLGELFNHELAHKWPDTRGLMLMKIIDSH